MLDVPPTQPTEHGGGRSQASVQTPPRSRRALELLQKGLSRPGAALAAVAIALLLACSSLGLELTADDHFHTIAVREQPGTRGVARAPWDLYAFAKDPLVNRELMEGGTFPWWTDPALVLQLFRPLSSLTLWLDRTLWPDSALLMHVHSLLWFGLLLGAVYLVYRESGGSREQVALSLLLYAIDDARSMPIGWVAHRTALVALAPAFLALWAHQRWRARGSRACAVLAPLCLMVGFCAGELALQICGYLFAYALFVDRGTRLSRALSLVPCALVVIGWRLLYDRLGYGALNSDIYIDLGREPWEFAQATVVRLPVLLLSQFALPFADLWEIYPLFAGWLQPAVLLLAALVVGALLWVLWPLLRADRQLRFWALGTLLATIPVCGTHPEDRVLGATGLGGAALVAAFLLALWERRLVLLVRSAGRELPRPRRAAILAGSALSLIHLVFAPLLLPLRTLAIDQFEGVMESADPSIVQGPEAAHKTVVLLNPPIDFFAVYFPSFRAARGTTLPQHFRWLATGESALSVARVDDHTLRVTPRDGFLATSSQRVFRRADRTFAPGEVVALSDVSFRVTAFTEDGRPAELLARFQQPLDSESLQWLRWGRRGYVRFELPRAGETVTIPPVDLAATLVDDASESAP
jgi:hypothetical protein